MADSLWNIHESESENFMPGKIFDNSSIYTAILSEIRHKVGLSFIHRLLFLAQRNSYLAYLNFYLSLAFYFFADRCILRVVGSHCRHSNKSYHILKEMVLVELRSNIRRFQTSLLKYHSLIIDSMRKLVNLEN